MKICVIGLGYVGLPLAVGLADAGHDVVGFDLNGAVIEALGLGQSHIQGIDQDDLERVNNVGASWVSDPATLPPSDVFIICVPTPLGASGFPDLSYVESAAAIAGSCIRPGGLVILESSTHPGTTEEVVAPILQETSGLHPGVDFHLAYSPERIDPGNDHFTVTNTPKIVGGITAESSEQARLIYESMGIPVVVSKGLKEAELAKLLENTYRHVNIALVNELVKFCRPLGIDLWDAIRCARTKPFGFEAFFPGPGVGGHCIPVDPHYLSHQVRLKLGRPFRFVELAQEINGSMPAYVVERLQEELNELGCPVANARVLLLGVTYKRDVADLRETPAADVVRILRDLGADLSYADPYINDWAVDGEPVSSIRLAGARDFDSVILLQDHSAFSPEQILTAGRVVLDTRAVLDDPRVTRL